VYYRFPNPSSTLKRKNVSNTTFRYGKFRLMVMMMMMMVGMMMTTMTTTTMIMKMKMKKYEELKKAINT